MSSFALIHGPECDPEDHPEWVKTTAFEAFNTHKARCCAKTAYIADELFPGETVWVELPAADRLAEEAGKR